ncbi:MAG: hypothetical protein HY814_06335 [Candidatus Riflebacteria bacterium]|nr:hypothetical protein [Candidatus Riflebacteria bacterium]
MNRIETLLAVGPRVVRWVLSGPVASLAVTGTLSAQPVAEPSKAVTPGLVLGTKPAETLARLLASQGLVAAAVGECDLAFGLETLESLAREAAFPILAANLTTKGGRRPFRGAAVVPCGGNRIAFIALASPSLSIQALHPALRLEPPAKALTRELAAVRGRVGHVVLLAHLPAAEAEALVRKVRGVDVAILGHGAGRTREPRRVGKTLVVGSDVRGRELGELTLVSGPGGPVWKHRLIALTPSLGEDPAVAAVVERVHREQPPAAPARD